MKKPRFRRFGIGTGTKVQQSNLRALAKDMAEDADMIIPECIGQCSRCPAEKLRQKLRKIQSFRENPAALLKLASRGTELEKAYASMLILAAETTPIMFATARLPSGDVGYTVRGKAKKEFLIGLQHFDDPRLRLLAYSELAVKKKVHVYSSEDWLQCSGKEPKYPQELAAEVLKASGYLLKKVPDGYACEHAGEGYSIRIDIESSAISVEICKSCASKKHNLFTELTSRVLTKHPESDFRITLEHDIECSKGDDCSISRTGIKHRDILDRYRAGQLSDRTLAEEYEKAVRGALQEAGKPIFVLGNRCFEEDYGAFVKALEPSELEEKALNRLLKSATGPVVMDTATPNAVLALFWDTLGATAIYSVTGDKELARKIYGDAKNSGKTPAQILRDAKIACNSKTALACLPELRKLGKTGKYLDELARTYKAMGKEETLKSVGTVQEDTKLRSINCGFLIALGALKGKEWQFTKEEQDYGTYLSDFVRALLESLPENYTDSLQNLLTASGSNETVG